MKTKEIDSIIQSTIDSETVYCVKLIKLFEDCKKQKTDFPVEKSNLCSELIDCDLSFGSIIKTYSMYYTCFCRNLYISIQNENFDECIIFKKCIEIEEELSFKLIENSLDDELLGVIKQAKKKIQIHFGI